MSDHKLRSKLIHLANTKPELREHLLPILKEASDPVLENVGSPPKYKMAIKVHALRLLEAPPDQEYAAFGALLRGCSDYAKKGLGIPNLWRILTKAEDFLEKNYILPSVRDILPKG